MNRTGRIANSRVCQSKGEPTTIIGVLNDEDDDNALRILRQRQRCFRNGARTRTDRAGRYMLVYDCRRGQCSVRARTTLAPTDDVVFVSPTATGAGHVGPTVARPPPGNVFPFFFLFTTSSSSLGPVSSVCVCMCTC